ncbi:polyphosphate kinase 1 [Schlesneria sp. DSM 10557]|uniref:polyphosphate kinase 1 n=1 Tax=Schlesneria sp. DSM 10557 TaxID=3044399 RepID=UPI00359FC106
MTAEPRFFNRELSWLEFNQRVLDEASDKSIPLLERLKFLAITASNLDEFTMVRVGSLQILQAEGEMRPDPVGLTTSQQLKAIGERMQAFLTEQYRCFLEDIEPALAAAGMNRLRAAQLNDRQLQHLQTYFDQEVFPILTPLAIVASSELSEAARIELHIAKRKGKKKKAGEAKSTDAAAETTGSGTEPPSLEFPPLINQTISLCVRLAPIAGATEPRFAILPFGRNRQRFVTVPSESGFNYILLEDVISLFLPKFFPGETIEESVAFRITRNADLELQEDQAFDLLSKMQEIVNARRQSACVRLELADHASPLVRSFLQTAVDVPDRWVFAAPGPLDLAAFFRLTDSQGFDNLRYEPWPSQPSLKISPSESLFSAISRQDILLYHPYESFDSVVRLVEEAADDPDVLAIKQTLYRTSAKSPIVAALKRAAQKGKYVTAVVELKARFDEQRNIEWARDLERADVQVVYGVKGLKTHAKICLIVRREPQGIQRYVHFGTGNYNEITSRIYSDVSLMSCHEDLGADATAFFNAITGYSQPQRFRQIEMAPIGLRERLLEMIEAEIDRKRHKQKALIIAKMNALVDETMIEALYAASQAGVRIRLNIRGVCCLRPGVPGLSENITVTGVIDRFLEHARILYFYHGGDERLFISSADWMPRNLDRRVELLVPVEDNACRRNLITILKTTLADNVKARRLLPSGRYEPVRATDSSDPIRSQEVLYRRTGEAIEDASRAALATFEPLRGAGHND